MSNPTERQDMSKDRSPRRGRPPNREAEGRNRRVPMGVAVLKLDVPQAVNDPEHVYRWINDKPGRIQRARTGGWEFVEDPGMQVGTGSETRNSQQDSRVSQVVGKNENGTPLVAFLMRIKREWYHEDQETKQASIDEVENTIKGGRYKEGAGDGRYIPKEGIKIG